MWVWFFFFFSSRRRHTRCSRDWSSDVCSSDLKWKVDRSTVTHICQVAKRGALDALSASVPGRPGMTAEAAELAAAREEIGRPRATVTEPAVALHLHQGKPGWDCRLARPPPGLAHPPRPS